MQAEASLGRIALWFFVLIAAIAVMATTADAGFAVHAAIVGFVALLLLAMSATRFDPGGAASGFFRIPDTPTRYDDDPVRWGVLATMFWGMAGFLAAIAIAVLLVAYSIVGFSVLHAITRNAGARTWILTGVWIAVLVLGWPLLFIAMLGLADSVFNLRNRFGAQKPPFPPVQRNS